MPFDFGEGQINLHDAVQATCFVNKGDPPKEITWWFEDEFGNERKLSTNDGIVITKTSSRTSILNIEEVMGRHRGLYKCRAGTALHSTRLSINGSYSFFINLFFVSLLPLTCPSISSNFAFRFWRRPNKCGRFCVYYLHC